MKWESGWGKPTGNYSASMIVDRIIEEVIKKMKQDDFLKEFDTYRNGDDNDDKFLDFISTLEVIVQSVRHAEDLKRETYAELMKRANKNWWRRLLVDRKVKNNV